MLPVGSVNMGLREKFRQFMQGRYGIDSLGRALAVVYLVLAVINMFFVSGWLYFLGLAIFAVLVFRVLSRNTTKRYDENLKFQKFSNSFSGFFRKVNSRANQNKIYCFKRCPNCGKTLRLPRKRGKHGTRCPVCGCNFKVRVWFGNK